jgi:hypothetical protein
MSIWIVLSLAFSLLLGLYLVRPFFEAAYAGGDATVGLESLQSLSDSKERALRAIKDLELDFSMGKISQEDFDRAKNELSIELAGVLEEIRQHGQR